VTRRRQIATVAEFEFLSIVRTKGYLFSTLGMPAMLLAYGLFAGWLGDLLGSQVTGGAQVFGVVDRAAILELEEQRLGTLVDLPQALKDTIAASGEADALGAVAYYTDTLFREYGDPESATAALLAEEITGFAVIPPDFVATGAIDLYSGDKLSLPSRTARRNLTGLLRERFLQRAPESARARIDTPIAQTNEWIIDDAGEVGPNDTAARILRLGIPGAFIMVFLISLLTTTGYLVQGTATEKESRVVEVLLSATAPEEILAGKLLGLGAAGLLQVLVWFSMVIAGAAIMAGIAIAAGVAFPMKALAVGMVFFLAAYFFYGAIMLAFASFGNSQLEVQKLAGFWTILAAVPMVFIPALMNTPHGTAARVLSWVPFTAPLTVLARVALDPDGLPWWDLGLSLLILLVSTWMALRLGARLFRVGLLAMGSRPKLREIWRQARLSS
jgi:ABC-2 type transport system permease protein